MRLLGRARRFPLAPAPNKKAPMEAAMPKLLLCQPILQHNDATSRKTQIQPYTHRGKKGRSVWCEFNRCRVQFISFQKVAHDRKRTIPWPHRKERIASYRKPPYPRKRIHPAERHKQTIQNIQKRSAPKNQKTRTFRYVHAANDKNHTKPAHTATTTKTTTTHVQDC